MGWGVDEGMGVGVVTIGKSKHRRTISNQITNMQLESQQEQKEKIGQKKYLKA